MRDSDAVRDLLLLPVKLPLRIIGLQLRIARAAAELGFDMAREAAVSAAREVGREVAREREAAEPHPESAPVPDPAAPKPRGRPAAPEPPAARGPTPDAEPEAAKPRPRRAARKATAAKPARRRSSEPTRGQAAARREAEREAEAAAGGEGGFGSELRAAEPWPGYDAMALDEVLARLQDAGETELAIVALYESQNENRQAILLACERPEP